MRRFTQFLVCLVFGVGCQEDPEAATMPEEDESPVSSAASAVGTALSYVADLPESRDPIQFGSRTFRVSGNVLVKVDAEVADVESVIRERGWTLVRESPRVCGRSVEFAGWYGYPHCWLGGDPDALYLRVSSVRDLGSGDYGVVVHPYRNVAVPDDHYLNLGLQREFTGPLGPRYSEYDAEGHRAEYVRLLSGTSDHPGILSDGGELRVLFSGGAVIHEGEFSGPYFSNPNGGDELARGHYRQLHFGPYSYYGTEDYLRADAVGKSCYETYRGRGELYDGCMLEFSRLVDRAEENNRERQRAARERARAIVGEEGRK